MDTFEKTYSFNNDHNPRLPAQYWFQDTPEGLLLFVVFYTQACRWNRCTGCNLPSLSSENHVGYKDILRQIDFIFHNHLSDADCKKLRKIVISNNGSVLDEKTFSSSALDYFVMKMNLNCPNISCLTLETRPEYVDEPEIEFLNRTIIEGDTPTDLELAVGFEAFDEEIRNTHFQKGLKLSSFENMVSIISKYKELRLKTYFMLKPVPGLSEEDAVKDIKNGMEYLSNISREHKIPINMHLNPTYAAKDTVLEKAFLEGTYTPPLYESVIDCIKFAESKNISLYVGYDDEGLSVEGGNFLHGRDKGDLDRIIEFNKTQNYKLL